MKYIVLKRTAVDYVLDESQKSVLQEITRAIDSVHAATGKPPNRYAVVNLDEPYANEVIEIMRRHGHWESEVSA